MNLPGGELLETDFAKLAQSGITSEHAQLAMLRRVESHEGGALIGRNGGGDWAGVVFPYVWPGEDRVREYRLRRDRPDLEQKPGGGYKERGKYLAPPGRGNLLYLVPGTQPEWLDDVSLPVVLVEGEKKAIAVWAISWYDSGDTSDKPSWLPVAIPGVWNWQGVTGKGPGPDGDRRNIKGPIPDLDRVAWNGRTVTIVFDANVRTNESVRAARQGLTRELRRRGAIVLWVELPELPGVNGIDDLIGRHGGKVATELIKNAAAPSHEPRKVTQPNPKVLDVAEILALDIPEASMLIEGILPAAGASLIVGAAKSGKTLAAIQMAIAVASGEALYGNYRVLTPGPVLIVEQDDPAGAGSIKTILQRSGVSVAGIPFHLVERTDFQFGAEFLEWLESQIVKLKVKYTVLDSYTALRGSRPKGVDIVKAEQGDLTLVDAVGKRTNSALSIIHHSSKGSAGLDWSEKAAGTFAMSAATESQMFISRFPELDGAATERLVRIRGRHSEDLEMVLRFRKETLDYELVLEGGAATLYPVLLQLQTAFGPQAFSPKEVAHATGLSIATAHRQITRLYRANAIQKRGFGEYVLVAR